MVKYTPTTIVKKSVIKRTRVYLATRVKVLLEEVVFLGDSVLGWDPEVILLPLTLG
jgi:hypothetical protein